MGLFNDPKNLHLNYGIKTAAGLIAFFVLMWLVGLGHHVELRLLNLFILTAGIFFGLKKFKETHEDHLNYFRALITGVSMGAIGSIIFAVFMFIWMKVDAEMMNAIIENEPMGRYLNAYITAFVVALEGVFSGLLVTFVLINWVTTDDVNDPVGESK